MTSKNLYQGMALRILAGERSTEYVDGAGAKPGPDSFKSGWFHVVSIKEASGGDKLALTLKECQVVGIIRL